MVVFPRLSLMQFYLCWTCIINNCLKKIGYMLLANTTCCAVRCLGRDWTCSQLVHDPLNSVVLLLVIFTQQYILEITLLPCSYYISSVELYISLFGLCIDTGSCCLTQTSLQMQNPLASVSHMTPHPVWVLFFFQKYLK